MVLVVLRVVLWRLTSQHGCNKLGVQYSGWCWTERNGERWRKREREKNITTGERRLEKERTVRENNWERKRKRKREEDMIWWGLNQPSYAVITISKQVYYTNYMILSYISTTGMESPHKSEWTGSIWSVSSIPISHCATQCYFSSFHFIPALIPTPLTLSSLTPFHHTLSVSLSRFFSLLYEQKCIKIRRKDNTTTLKRSRERGILYTQKKEEWVRRRRERERSIEKRRETEKESERGEEKDMDR